MDIRLINIYLISFFRAVTILVVYENLKFV